MHDIILPLINPNGFTPRSVEAGRVIIAPGEPTSLLFLLRAGEARSSDGSCLVAGDIPSLCEALALDRYHSTVDAVTACELQVIPLQDLESAIRQGGRLAWPLSRSIAAEVTQRRLAG
jgi:CRP-like cAMP-binding protein